MDVFDKEFTSVVRKKIMDVLEIIEKDNQGGKVSLRSARFAEVFSSAEQIPFNHEWSNGSGYFDFAVKSSRRDSPHVPDIPVGEYRASVTPGNTRRLLFISTYLGMIVIFDRYRQEDGVFAYNADSRILRGEWIGYHALSDDDMCFLLGDPGTKGIRGGIVDVIKSLREYIIDDLKGVMK